MSAQVGPFLTLWGRGDKTDCRLMSRSQSRRLYPFLFENRFRNVSSRTLYVQYISRLYDEIRCTAYYSESSSSIGWFTEFRQAIEKTIRCHLIFGLTADAAVPVDYASSFPLGGLWRSGPHYRKQIRCVDSTFVGETKSRSVCKTFAEKKLECRMFEVYDFLAELLKY